MQGIFRRPILPHERVRGLLITRKLAFSNNHLFHLFFRLSKASMNHLFSSFFGKDQFYQTYVCEDCRRHGETIILVRVSKSKFAKIEFLFEIHATLSLIKHKW